MSFTHEARVYYEDTDAGGVVYYANYLKFAERARTEWLRELGFEQSALWKSHDVGFVVKHCSIDYHKSAQLDDVLHIRCDVSSKRAVGFEMQQQITDASGALLATLQVTLICVNAALKPKRLPKALSDLL